MKTAENRRGDDAVAVANPMASQHRRDVRAIGNARAQARVWTPAIVMRDPLPKDAAEVRLVQQNHPVQALAPNGTDHPFAEHVGVSCQMHRQPTVRHKPFASPIRSIRGVARHFS